jgi:ubiquinone/menaquinone biosynthesis C-methylase UbiE
MQVFKFLHVGCGPKRKDRTTVGFNRSNWVETRFDIDPSVAPDIQGTMTDMSVIPDGEFDALFSSHNVEHLYPDEVPIAFKEFARVLKEDGFAVITCPDLQSVAKLVAEDRLTETAYESPAGPIAPIDILYGHRRSIEIGNRFMAHHSGFTRKVLAGSLRQAGFRSVGAMARAKYFDLWAVASRSERIEAEMRALAAEHFPAAAT